LNKLIRKRINGTVAVGCAHWGARPNQPFGPQHRKQRKLFPFIVGDPPPNLANRRLVDGRGGVGEQAESTGGRLGVVGRRGVTVAA
jgi:hypothetical protein